MSAMANSVCPLTMATASVPAAMTLSTPLCGTSSVPNSPRMVAVQAPFIFSASSWVLPAQDSARADSVWLIAVMVSATSFACAISRLALWESPIGSIYREAPS